MTNDIRTLSDTEIDVVAGGGGAVFVAFAAGMLVGGTLVAGAALLGAGAKVAYDYVEARGNTATNGAAVNTSLAEVIEGGGQPEGDGGHM